jgi:hypothetical protein
LEVLEIVEKLKVTKIAKKNHPPSMPPKSKSGGKKATAGKANGKGSDPVSPAVESATPPKQLNEEQMALVDAERSCTGVLASNVMSRDVLIEQFALYYHGRLLIDNATIELNFGRRYGLIGKCVGDAMGRRRPWCGLGPLLPASRRMMLSHHHARKAHDKQRDKHRPHQRRRPNARQRRQLASRAFLPVPTWVPPKKKKKKEKKNEGKNGAR